MRIVQCIQNSLHIIHIYEPCKYSFVPIVPCTWRSQSHETLYYYTMLCYIIILCSFTMIYFMMSEWKGRFRLEKCIYYFSAQTNTYVRPGVCPPIPPGFIGSCVNECETDFQCNSQNQLQNMKCCANGCGRSCMIVDITGSKYW